MLQSVFIEVFSKLKDSRVERAKKHLFLDVIGLALFATLAGAQCFTEMEDFCKIHSDFLKKYFKLQCGIPSHDTFCRVFSEKTGFKNMTHYTATDEVNKDHGRIESRKCIVYFMMLKSKWKGLRSLVLIISERETHAEKTVEYRYYISSLDPKDPKKIMSSIRTHWQIENNLHWLLDVAYREDQSRIRDENTGLIYGLKKRPLVY